MLTAAILFTLTALGGATAASFPLRGIPRPPTWLALGHGAVAIVSFGALAYAASTETLSLLEQLAAGALGLAAIGGLTMFLAFICAASRCRCCSSLATAFWPLPAWRSSGSASIAAANAAF